MVACNVTPLTTIFDTALLLVPRHVVGAGKRILAWIRERLLHAGGVDASAAGPKSLSKGIEIGTLATCWGVDQR